MTVLFSTYLALIPQVYNSYIWCAQVPDEFAMDSGQKCAFDVSKDVQVLFDDQTVGFATPLSQGYLILPAHIGSSSLMAGQLLMRISLKTHDKVMTLPSIAQGVICCPIGCGDFLLVIVRESVEVTGFEANFHDLSAQLVLNDAETDLELRPGNSGKPTRISKQIMEKNGIKCNEMIDSVLCMFLGGAGEFNDTTKRYPWGVFITLHAVCAISYPLTSFLLNWPLDKASTCTDEYREELRRAVKTSDEKIKEIEMKTYEPCTLMETLAYGALIMISSNSVCHI